jgi:hypothetical protein
MPLILVFIEGFVGRPRVACPLLVTLPFGVAAADADVSEVLPSCEWVEAEDAEALDGSGTCTFVDLAGDSVCADMSSKERWSIIASRCGRETVGEVVAETRSLAVGAKAPSRRYSRQEWAARNARDD